jgi:hypothetical protein
VGHVKYLYLGQLTHGQEAIDHLTKGIEVMESVGVAGEREEGSIGGACGGGEDEDVKEQLSGAYCALAEVYLTDTW